MKGLRFFFKSNLFLLSLTLFLCGFQNNAFSNVSDASFDEAKLSSLYDTLKSGGNVIIFRHTQKEDVGPDGSLVRKAFDTADAALSKPITVPREYADLGLGMCLTNLGKANAWLLGEVFRRLELPINKVLTSATCRTRQHAEIMFENSEKIEVQPALIFGGVTKKSEISKTHRRKSTMFVEDLEKEHNLVVIAHGKTAQEAGLVDFWPKQGDALIFRPNRKNQLKLIAHLSSKHFVLMLPNRKKW